MMQPQVERAQPRWGQRFLANLRQQFTQPEGLPTLGRLLPPVVGAIGAGVQLLKGEVTFPQLREEYHRRLAEEQQRGLWAPATTGITTIPAERALTGLLAANVPGQRVMEAAGWAAGLPQQYIYQPALGRARGILTGELPLGEEVLKSVLRVPFGPLGQVMDPIELLKNPQDLAGNVKQQYAEYMRIQQEAPWLWRASTTFAAGIAENYVFQLLGTGTVGTKIRAADRAAYGMYLATADDSELLAAAAAYLGVRAIARVGSERYQIKQLRKSYDLAGTDPRTRTLQDVETDARRMAEVYKGLGFDVSEDAIRTGAQEALYGPLSQRRPLSAIRAMAEMASRQFGQPEGRVGQVAFEAHTRKPPDVPSEIWPRLWASAYRQYEANALAQKGALEFIDAIDERGDWLMKLYNKWLQGRAATPETEGVPSDIDESVAESLRRTFEIDTGAEGLAKYNADEDAKSGPLTRLTEALRQRMREVGPRFLAEERGAVEVPGLGPRSMDDIRQDLRTYRQAVERASRKGWPSARKAQVQGRLAELEVEEALAQGKPIQDWWREVYPDLVARYEKAAAPAEPVPGAPPEAAKQPWEMTVEEYIATGTARAQKERGQPTLRSNHRSFVRNALQDGLPIPPEVLADYPDLAVWHPPAPEAPVEAPPPSENVVTLVPMKRVLVADEILSVEAELTTATALDKVFLREQLRDLRRAQSQGTEQYVAEATKPRAGTSRFEVEGVKYEAPNTMPVQEQMEAVRVGRVVGAEPLPEEPPPVALVEPEVLGAPAVVEPWEMTERQFFDYYRDNFTGPNRMHTASSVQRTIDLVDKGIDPYSDVNKWSTEAGTLSDMTNLYRGYLRQGEGRLAPAPALEAPAVAEPAEPPPVPAQGRRVTAYGVDPNVEYEFVFRVVDLDDLIPSHTDALSPHPDYPKEVQPRLRERMASQAQIMEIYTRFKPDVLLTDVRSLERGPMIIGDDLAVESGNARVLVLRKLRQENPELWREYGQQLIGRLDEWGIAPSEVRGIASPVLVRQRLTEVDREAFAQEANLPSVLAMSAAESAVQDAKRLSENAVSALVAEEGESAERTLLRASNRGIVREFLDSFTVNERAKLIDKEGNISMYGLQRLKAALFAKTYGGKAGQVLNNTFFESVDANVRMIERGMFSSLPWAARVESLMRVEQRDSGLSLSDDLAAAVNVLARLKQERLSVSDYMAQRAMWERELTPLQEKLLAHLDEISRSSKKVREFIGAYVEGIERSPILGELPGMEVAKPTKEGILDAAIQSQAEPEVVAPTLFERPPPEAPVAEVPEAAPVEEAPAVAEERAQLEGGLVEEAPEALPAPPVAFVPTEEIPLPLKAVLDAAQRKQTAPEAAVRWVNSATASPELRAWEILQGMAREREIEKIGKQLVYETEEGTLSIANLGTREMPQVQVSYEPPPRAAVEVPPAEVPEAAPEEVAAGPPEVPVGAQPPLIPPEEPPGVGVQRRLPEEPPDESQWSLIRRARREAEGKPPLVDRIKSLTAKAMLTWIDRFDPVKRLPGGLKAYNEFALLGGTQKRAQSLLEQHFWPNLRRVEDHWDEFWDYMVARRMPDLQAIAEEIGVEAKLPAGVIAPEAAIAEMEAELGPEVMATFNEVAEDFWANNQRLMVDYAVSTHLLSQQGADAMKTRHPHYVPYYRQGFDAIQDLAAETLGRGGTRTPAAFSKRMKKEGSLRAIKDPFQSFVESFVNLYRQGANNMAVRSLVSTLRAADPALVEEGDRTRTGWAVAKFREKGETVTVTVPHIHARIAESLDGYTMGLIGELFRRLSRPLVLGAVRFNPDFVIRNIGKDAQRAFLNVGLIPMARGWIEAWADVLTHGEAWHEAAQAGALGGGYAEIAGRPGPLRRLGPMPGIPGKKPKGAMIVIRKAADLVWLLPRITELSEEGTRVAMWQKMKDRGLIDEEAALLTQTGTTNFWLAGFATRVLTNLSPFLSARVGGVRDSVAAIRRDPRKSVARYLALVLPSVILYLWNKRFETADAIPDYQYLKNWNLIIGEGTREPDPRYPGQAPERYPIAVKIAKSENTTLITAVPEALLRMGSYIDDGGPIEIALRAQLQGILEMSPIDVPALMPPVTGTAAQIAMNRDIFRQRDIVPQRELGRPPEDQYGPETSKVAIGLGEQFKISPRYIDFAIADVLAGGGRALTWLSDLALGAMGYDPSVPGRARRQEFTGIEKLAQAPVVRAVLGTRATQPYRRGYRSLDKEVAAARRTLYQNPDVKRFGLGVNPPGSTVTVDGVPHEVTPEQRAEIVGLSTPRLKLAWDELIGRPFYIEMDDTEKYRMLNRVRSKVQGNVRASVLQAVRGEPTPLWNEAQMPELITAYEQYREWEALPKYIGLTAEEEEAVGRAQATLSSWARVSPDTPTPVLRALYAEQDPMAVQLLQYVSKLRSPARQQYWAAHPLLARYFGGLEEEELEMLLGLQGQLTGPALWAEQAWGRAAGRTPLLEAVRMGAATSGRAIPGARVTGVERWLESLR